jgi:23S rRNA pseudouridine1911/1915/1917 synthase
LFKILPRQALHAKTLDLFILQRVMMRFDTELPQDFQDCIENGEDTLKPI